MKHLIRTAALSVLFAAIAATPALAQVVVPTAEGTVITNTATANYKDANGNAYAPVEASVSVTIGFVSGIDILASSPTLNTGTGTNGSASFTITNTGNGTDQFALQPPSSGSLIITGYTLNGVTYGTLAELNAALAATNVASGSSLVVTVNYSVPNNVGGTDQTITIAVTSVRANSTTDNDNTVVSPPLVQNVTVTPDGATVSQVPTLSPGTYTYDFTVTNTGNYATTYSLTPTASNGSVLPSVSLSSSSIELAVGASAIITATYTVGNVDAGLSSTLTLTAQSAGASDTGTLTVTVIKPSLSMTKQAYRSNQSTLISGDAKVLPGETIAYKISVTNGGSSVANNVVITDPLPSGVTFVSASGDAEGWSISGGANLSASLSGSLAAGATRFIWIVVTIN